MADCEYRLPACDWIGADYGVDSLQVLADVQGRASRSTVQFKVVITCSLIELWLRKGSGKTFEKPLVRCRNPIKELIARGPESICRSNRQQITARDEKGFYLHQSGATLSISRRCNRWELVRT